MPSGLHLRPRVRRQHCREGRRRLQFPDWRPGRRAVFHCVSGMLLLREGPGESVRQGRAVWKLGACEYGAGWAGRVCEGAVGEHDASEDT